MAVGAKGSGAAVPVPVPVPEPDGAKGSSGAEAERNDIGPGGVGTKPSASLDGWADGWMDGNGEGVRVREGCEGARGVRGCARACWQRGGTTITTRATVQ